MRSMIDHFFILPYEGQSCTVSRGRPSWSCFPLPIVWVKTLDDQFPLNLGKLALFHCLCYSSDPKHPYARTPTETLAWRYVSVSHQYLSCTERRAARKVLCDQRSFYWSGCGAIGLHSVNHLENSIYEIPPESNPYISFINLSLALIRSFRWPI